MHLVCCCSLPVWRRSFLKKGTPRYLFLSRPGSAPARIWPKNNNTCKGPWVLHPYQVSSKSIKTWFWRSWKCESLRRRTTTDGRRTVRYDKSSLERDTQKSDNTNTLPKSSITQWLRTDWDLSVGVSTATQLVVLNRFKGSQPFH